MNQIILKKLNKFAINQMIRIRDDESTARQIEKEILRCDVREKVFFLRFQLKLYF